MASRDTFSDLSPPPVRGDTFLSQYAERLKTLFDASAFPLTSVAGTGNTVTAALDPPLDSGGLVNGMKFTITWAAANTAAVTLSINGATPVPVVDADNVALGASALTAGRRSLLEYIGGSFRILSSAGGAGAGAGPTFQAFLSSGTWTKPSGYDDDTIVVVELWAAGGGGGRGSSGASGGGGGGGGYARREFRIADLPSSVPVTIGAGGAVGGLNGSASPGGNSQFGSLLTAFGGGGGRGSGTAGLGGGGGGGGEVSAGVTASAGQTGAAGRAGGGAGAPGNSAGSSAAAEDARTIWGGGGGGAVGSNTPFFPEGGVGVFGGGGGGSGYTGTVPVGLGGVSKFGGNGGAGASGGGAAGAGLAPGGGGGGAGNSGTPGAGARGECRVWIMG